MLCYFYFINISETIYNLLYNMEQKWNMCYSFNLEIIRDYIYILNLFLEKLVSLSQLLLAQLLVSSLTSLVYLSSFLNLEICIASYLNKQNKTVFWCKYAFTIATVYYIIQFEARLILRWLNIWFTYRSTEEPVN